MNKLITNKCTHCGKVWEVPYSSSLEVIKCPHCNKQYQLTKKTKRNREIAAYVAAFVIIFVFSFAFSSLLGQTSNTVMIGAFIIFGIIAAGLGRPIGQYLFFKFFGYQFEEVENKKAKK